MSELHGSTPAELKARLEVERRGICFLHYRDADGSQRIVELEAAGPEILLCTSGSIRGIARGGSVFVPAAAGRYRLEGRGVAFRATVGAI